MELRRHSIFIDTLVLGYFEHRLKAAKVFDKRLDEEAITDA